MRITAAAAAAAAAAARAIIAAKPKAHAAKAFEARYGKATQASAGCEANAARVGKGRAWRW